MKLVWTRLAAADRREIREYIAQDNPAAALALDELFSEKAGRLLDHSGLGRPGRVAGTRELVAHQNYIMEQQINALKLSKILANFGSFAFRVAGLREPLCVRATGTGGPPGIQQRPRPRRGYLQKMEKPEGSSHMVSFATAPNSRGRCSFGG